MFVALESASGIAMGRAKGIEGELVALTGTLEALDQQIEQAAQDVAGAARDKASLGASGDASARSRFDPIPQAWGTVRQTLVELVLAVADRNDEAMAPLEDKPQLTTSERLRAAFAQVLSMRWTRPAGPKARSLSEALTLADRLYGLLLARRERILSLRHAVESDLVELMGHRALLAENLLASAEREERETSAVARQVEDSLQAIQDLAANLNRQVRELNGLLNKLTLEAERAIVLSCVLADEGAMPGSSPGLDKALLAHLRPLIELHENDMLSSIEIERRRAGIDARFRAAFEDFGDEAASGERTILATPEVQHA
jgi:hypothetical protein